jgi:hypothetical protein
MGKGNSRSALFLTEMIIAILIFALSMGICGSVFARSFAAASESTNLNNAVFQAESAAEAFHALPSPEALAEALGGASDGGVVTVLFDAGWEAAAPGSEAPFALVAEISADGPMETAAITVFGRAGTLVELNVSKNTELRRASR